MHDEFLVDPFHKFSTEEIRTVNGNGLYGEMISMLLKTKSGESNATALPIRVNNQPR